MIKEKMKTTNKLICILLFSLVLTAYPSQCQAFQAHSPPEGLYVHQMAHLLFGGALAYLYWRLGHSSFFVSLGWYYLRIFCLLFVIWNVMTFTGHASYSYLSVGDFANRDTWQSTVVWPITPVKILYYIGRFEHLTSVPAIFYLFLGLRVFCREAREEADK